MLSNPTGFQERIDELHKRCQQTTSIQAVDGLLSEARFLLKECFQTEFEEQARALFRKLRDKKDAIESGKEADSSSLQNLEKDKNLAVPVSEKMAQGRRLFYAGEYLEALNLFHEVLIQDPANEEARSRLLRAEDSLERGLVPITCIPFEARESFGRAQSLERAGRLIEAREEYQKALHLASEGGIPNWQSAIEASSRLESAVIAQQLWTEALEFIEQRQWSEAIERLESAEAINRLERLYAILDDSDFKQLLNLIHKYLEMPNHLVSLVNKTSDLKQQYQDFLSLREQLETEYLNAPITLRQDLTQQLNSFTEQLGERVSEQFFAHMGRGGRSLDTEEYLPAVQYFSQAVDLTQACPGFIKLADVDDAQANLRLAQSLHDELTTLQKGFNNAQRVLQEGDSCTAVDILLRILQQPPKGQQAKSLATEARKLKKKALVLCAEKISEKGGYARARAILEPYAEDDDTIQKSLDKITDRQNREMADKAHQKKDLMEDLKSQSRVWFTLGTIASILGGMLLIAGAAGAFFGNVSSAVVSSLSAILPGVFAALFYNHSDKLRAERVKIIEKTTDEEKLDIEAQRKALGLLENGTKKITPTSGEGQKL